MPVKSRGGISSFRSLLGHQTFGTDNQLHLFPSTTLGRVWGRLTLTKTVEIPRPYSGSVRPTINLLRLKSSGASRERVVQSVRRLQPVPVPQLPGYDHTSDLLSVFVPKTQSTSGSRITREHQDSDRVLKDGRKAVEITLREDQVHSGGNDGTERRQESRGSDSGPPSISLDDPKLLRDSARDMLRTPVESDVLCVLYARNLHPESQCSGATRRDRRRVP